MAMSQDHKEPVGNSYTFAKTIGNVRPELETNMINSDQKLLAAQPGALSGLCCVQPSPDRTRRTNTEKMSLSQRVL
jgi:hypothetical protein